MKILMLSQLYPPIIGGVERHVQTLSNELKSRGHDIVVCTILSPGLIEYEEEDGVRIYRLEGFFQKIPFIYKDRMKKWHPPIQDMVLTTKLAHIIDKEKPDVIHAHGRIVFSVLPLKKRYNIPIILSLHTYEFICPKTNFVCDKKICDRPFTRNCITCSRAFYGLAKSIATYYSMKMSKGRLEHVDKFIALSQFVREVHCEYLIKSRCERISLVPGFYSHNVDSLQEQGSSLPEDFILFVGALSPYKGVDVLIRAYQQLNSRVKLVLIGSTHPDYQYLNSENIIVIRNAPDSLVMQAFSKCRFTVFPSVWPEPLGIVAVEAMSQKKAVIASNIGGLKDVIVDGETGLLVTPGDSNELANAIAKLLDDPAIASFMGDKGYERYIKNFTPDVVVPKYIELYASI